MINPDVMQRAREVMNGPWLRALLGLGDVYANNIIATELAQAIQEAEERGYLKGLEECEVIADREEKALTVGVNAPETWPEESKRLRSKASTAKAIGDDIRALREGKKPCNQD